MCILVLKKCKRSDVYVHQRGEGVRQGQAAELLSKEHIERIIETYRDRPDEIGGTPVESTWTRSVNDFNLNISRYISAAEPDEQIDLKRHGDLMSIEEDQEGEEGAQWVLEELDLKPLP